MTSEEQYEIYI